MDRRVSEIVLQPILTEKSLKEAKLGRYTFLVAKASDKKEIKEAIEKLFGVVVKRVYTNIIKGSKTIRNKRRVINKSFIYKKARALLAKGQTIEAFAEKEGEKK